MALANLDIKPALLALALTASPLFLSGCGSDSSSSSDSTSETTSDSSTDSSTDTSTDSSTDSSSDSSSDSSTDSSDSTTTVDCSSDDYATELACAANALLDSLDSSQLATMQYDFSDSEARTVWSNLPTGNVQRNGVKLGDMTTAQKALAMNLASVALSEAGYLDFQGILAADDYLQEQGGGSDYSSDNYYFAVFGTPSASDQWQLQIGGHHLAYNLTYLYGEGYPVPNHFASEPKESFVLNSETWAPIEDEGNAMVAVFDSLSSDELSTAYLSGQSFSDVLVGPDNGSGTLPTDYPSGSDRTGLLVSYMSDAQQALVVAAIEQWVRDFPADVVDSLMETYTSDAAFADTYVAWAGSESAGVDIDNTSTYMRIDGPRLWIEVAVQGGIVIRSETHYHTMYRDKTMDYGNSL